MNQSVAKYNTAYHWPLNKIKTLRQKHPQRFAQFIQELRPAARKRAIMISSY